MPTADQLSHLEPVDGDGASVVTNDDASTQTSWPDGTVRVDETDGRAMITFPDFSVLNIETDGSRTLNDVNGTPLDLTTGEPPGGAPPMELPTPEPTTTKELQDFVEGVSSISDLARSTGILRAFNIAGVVDHQYGALAELAGAFEEALTGELSPASWFIQPVKALLAVVDAIEVEERGAGMRSWCYTVVYDAMGMGDPPEPAFAGSDTGAIQDAADRKWWDAARDRAHEQLADGQSGVALRNKVLLLIAKCGGNPGTAVTELWAAACRKSGDDDRLLKTYPVLDWPQPTGA